MVRRIRPEVALMPPTGEVRAALAKSMREAGRLRRLLRILETRDRDDLASPKRPPNRREAARP